MFRVIYQIFECGKVLGSKPSEPRHPTWVPAHKFRINLDIKSYSHVTGAM